MRRQVGEIRNDLPFVLYCVAVLAVHVGLLLWVQGNLGFFEHRGIGLGDLLLLSRFYNHGLALGEAGGSHLNHVEQWVRNSLPGLALGWIVILRLWGGSLLPALTRRLLVVFIVLAGAQLGIDRWYGYSVDTFLVLIGNEEWMPFNFLDLGLIASACGAILAALRGQRSDTTDLAMSQGTAP